MDKLIYSFEGTDGNTINRDSNQDNLYDIFQKIVETTDGILFFPTTVQREEAMRIDLVCKRLYESTIYVEELMVMNDIINPWSINQNDIIFYCDVDYMEALHYIEENTDNLIKTLVNLNKSTQVDLNRTDTQLPPTIKPPGLQSISVDKLQKKIKIINTFK